MTLLKFNQKSLWLTRNEILILYTAWDKSFRNIFLICIIKSCNEMHCSIFYFSLHKKRETFYWMRWCCWMKIFFCKFLKGDWRKRESYKLIVKKNICFSDLEEEEEGKNYFLIFIGEDRMKFTLKSSHWTLSGWKMNWISIWWINLKKLCWVCFKVGQSMS